MTSSQEPKEYPIYHPNYRPPIIPSLEIYRAHRLEKRSDGYVYIYPDNRRDETGLKTRVWQCVKEARKCVDLHHKRMKKAEAKELAAKKAARKAAQNVE